MDDKILAVYGLSADILQALGHAEDGVSANHVHGCGRVILQSDRGGSSAEPSGLLKALASHGSRVWAIPDYDFQNLTGP